MNIYVSIANYLKRWKSPAHPEENLQKQAIPQDKPREGNIKSVESESGFDFLDGMSTGTARFIIEREVDPSILKNYHIKDLENKGRYYLAKIINQDGKVTDTVLIDKLNRSIHFQKAKSR